MVRTLDLTTSQRVLLIGCGLGYLAKALYAACRKETKLCLVEPDPELAALAEANGYTSRKLPNVHCIVTGQLRVLSAEISALPTETHVIVAPYLRRLSRARSDPWSKYLHALSVELASAQVYNPLLAVTQCTNQDQLKILPSWNMLDLTAKRSVAVVGAGPSLDPCIQTLRAKRDDFTIIAASGACPALLSRNIVPDFVIALEALDTVLTDLNDLPASVPLIVFASTNSQVLIQHRNCFVGNPDGSPKLESRGGSSIIPALSLALKLVADSVFMIGVDLGAGSVPYANGVQRTFSYAADAPLPKFAAMRFHLDALLQTTHENTRVYHVSDVAVPLSGTTLLSTAALASPHYTNNVISLSHA